MNSVTPDTLSLPPQELRQVLGMLLKARALETGAIRWQRQGILPGYAPCLGQEAAQVGIAACMGPTDRAFPTYREASVALALGLDMGIYLSTHQGLWHGGLYEDSRFAPFQAVVAGSLLHATGWALGRRMDSFPDVAIAFLGDGASSQGDAHEAMNFAATMNAPVLFFVQNNGWAISTPTEKQVAGGLVSERAAGYGMKAYRVDGNDVEAVMTAGRLALEEIRSTGQPAILEAMTYRRGPHSTSDDPGRYRSLEAEQQASGVDPIDLATQRALAAGITQEEISQLETEANEWLQGVLDTLNAAQPRPGEEMFSFVFAEPTKTLTQQQDSWRKESERD